jgi:hypothetical protein
MGARNLLTGLSPKSSSLPDLARMLAEVGLELWQAPEGFWTVRLKQTPLLVPAQPTRRVRRTG